MFNIVLIAGNAIPCYDTAMRVVKVDSLPRAGFLMGDSILCQGQGTVLMANYTQDGNIGIYWNFGDGDTGVNSNTVQHSYDAIGMFEVSLYAQYRACPDTSFKNTINVYAYPIVNLGSDTAICPSQAPITLMDLHPDPNTGYKSLWSTGDVSSSINIYTPGQYWLNIDNNGCSTTDSVLVVPNCYIAIPNAFSPNGDGVNDYFFPREILARGVTAFHMHIYNRWGELIFETSSTDGRGWDGTFNNVPQPEGAYVYLIEVRFVNGVLDKYKGNVSLLR